MRLRNNQLTKITTVLALLLSALKFCSCAPKQHTVSKFDLRGVTFIRIPATRFTPGSRTTPNALFPTNTSVPLFYISQTEITAQQFCDYLNDTPQPATNTFAQLTRTAGTWHPAGNNTCIPIISITFDQAQKYCRWLTRKTGRPVRLPTELEWESAARAGLHQAPYAWGWGSPEGRAVWNTTGPAPVKHFPPNAYSLYDMCGNVYEWCIPSDPIPDNHHVARGGAWSETSPDYLTVYLRTLMPDTYKGTDTGFRITCTP